MEYIPLCTGCKGRRRREDPVGAARAWRQRACHATTHPALGQSGTRRGVAVTSRVTDATHQAMPAGEIRVMAATADGYGASALATPWTRSAVGRALPHASLAQPRKQKPSTVRPWHDSRHGAGRKTGHEHEADPARGAGRDTHGVLLRVDPCVQPGPGPAESSSGRAKVGRRSRVGTGNRRPTLSGERGPWQACTLGGNPQYRTRGQGKATVDGPSWAAPLAACRWPETKASVRLRRARRSGRRSMPFVETRATSAGPSR